MTGKTAGGAILLLLAATGALLSAIGARGAWAFQKDGCGGACADCHTLTPEEAKATLGGLVDKVLGVEMSPVGGLWSVDVEKDGNRWPVYIDFSKHFLISGQVIRLSNRENVTETRMTALTRVDVSAIPLDDAIVVGDPKATRKIIVFSDPDCHYCRLLHAETRKVTAAHPDVAFYVKIYSRNRNPATVRKALAVVCGKSEKLLDDAYEGKELPPPSCKTTAVEDTYRLAGKLGLSGTPAMVLPDGRVVKGYRPADALIGLLGAPAGAGEPPAKK